MLRADSCPFPRSGSTIQGCFELALREKQLVHDTEVSCVIDTHRYLVVKSSAISPPKPPSSPHTRLATPPRVLPSTPILSTLLRFVSCLYAGAAGTGLALTKPKDRPLKSMRENVGHCRHTEQTRDVDLFEMKFNGRR